MNRFVRGVGFARRAQALLACGLLVGGVFGSGAAWAAPGERAAGASPRGEGARSEKASRAEKDERAHKAERAAAESSAEAPRDAQTLLQRIQASTRGRSFEGTFVVSNGKAITSSRITHVCDGQDQVERVEVLGGPQRTVYRHNDLVQTLWPQSKRAFIEQRVTLRGFPALPVAVGEGVSQHYEMVSLGVDRVAGYEADVVLLKPRDDLRYAQRLWAERSTGMLLRADVLNDRGLVVESSAFSDLSIGPRKSIQALARRMSKLNGYEVTEASNEGVSLDGEGWVMRAAVPGFAHVVSVRRVVPVMGTGSAPTMQPVIQAIYADGLTHVSMFIEPYVADLHGAEGLLALGATHALMRRQGEWWITTVGDVPPATLRRFALGLERRAR
jgi:sigma-E factor negative regulatory protein RseB